MKRIQAIVAIALGICFVSAGMTAQQPSAQKQQGAKFAAVAPGERLPNLDKLKDELERYHDCTCTCGCYAKDLDVEADRAIAFLRRRAAHSGAKEKPAIVLDIDETTLSNYAEMLRRGFAYDSKRFDAWAETASAPAIPGTLRIYKEARRLGMSVFFITGRPETERTPTERNLRGQGFDDWQRLVMRTPAEAHATAQVYKSAARAAIESQGYRIVLNVGDQWSDLLGKPEAEFSVKYPDPFYFIK